MGNFTKFFERLFKKHFQPSVFEASKRAPFPLKNLATAQLNYTKVRKLNKTKKSSLVFGNRLGEFFLSLTCPHSQMCIGICIFDFRKQTNKQKKTRIQKKTEACNFVKKETLA